MLFWKFLVRVKLCWIKFECLKCVFWWFLKYSREWYSVDKEKLLILIWVFMIDEDWCFSKIEVIWFCKFIVFGIVKIM